MHNQGSRNKKKCTCPSGKQFEILVARMLFSVAQVSVCILGKFPTKTTKHGVLFFIPLEPCEFLQPRWDKTTFPLEFVLITLLPIRLCRWCFCFICSFWLFSAHAWILGCTSWWLEILQQTHDFNNKSEIPGLSKQVQLLLIVLCTVVKLTCWPAMHERPTRYATSDIKPGTRQFAHKRYVPVAPTTSGKNKIHCTCCKHKLVVADRRSKYILRTWKDVLRSKDERKLSKFPDVGNNPYSNSSEVERNKFAQNRLFHFF